MRILGIGGSSHDYCCCIVNDGKVEIAMEEERLSREKGARGARSQQLSGIRYCLNRLGLKLDDIDAVFSNNIMFRGKLEHLLKRKVYYINHHLAHAASAYYSSGWYESAILVIDGQGDIIATDPYQSENITLGCGLFSDIYTLEKKNGRIEPYATRITDGEFDVNMNSLGYLYETVTLLCGFGAGGQGKLMGLAAYGDDKHTSYMHKHVRYNGNQFQIDIKTISDYIYMLLHDKTGEALFSAKADIAYAVQQVLEEHVLTLINELYEKTKQTKLCVSGGVALNSSMNGRILRETSFEEVYIFPASGDAGTAIGAALYGYYFMSGIRFEGQNKAETAYYGPVYSDSEVEAAANQYKDRVTIRKVSQPELLNAAVGDLKQGKIIGWFQGGSEIGPRALGHRSIIANPMIKEMKDILNKRVKFRENFRPFAPSVLKEYVHEYFDFDQTDSNFMLYVCDVSEEKQGEIPSVTHVDGSARIQTVTKASNGLFYDLIEEFHRQSNIPLVLNTSFNIKSEPIVETPEDAISTFERSNIDTLYIHDYIVKKV